MILRPPEFNPISQPTPESRFSIEATLNWCIPSLTFKLPNVTRPPKPKPGIRRICIRFIALCLHFEEYLRDQNTPTLTKAGYSLGPRERWRALRVTLRRDVIGNVFGVAANASKQWRGKCVKEAQADEIEPRHALDDTIIDGTLKPWAGTGELYVNGKKVDEKYFDVMHISTYSLAETFDVGMDNGTQVDPNYEGSPFKFTGDLDRVTITLTD